MWKRAAFAFSIAVGLAGPAHAAETLSVWTSWGVVNDFVNQVGKEFSKQNPNYHVESTLFAQRALEAKIATSLPSGGGADIIIINTQAIWEYWDAKLLAKAPDADVAWAKQVFYPSAANDLSDYSGAMAGLPFIYYLEAMFYNTDHLAEAKIAKPPETIAELMTAAKAMTVVSDGVVKRQGINLRLGGGGAGVFEKFWAQALVPHGVEPLVRVGDKWRAGYNTPQGVDALNMYLRALYRDQSATPNLKGDAEGFSLGLSSSFQRESWVISYLNQNKSPVKYVTTLMPKGAKWGTIASTLGIIVPTSSKHKDAAFALAKFLNSPENSAKLVQTTGWMTARKDVDYAPVYATMPQIKTFVDSLATSGYVVHGYPRIPPLLEIVTRFSERLEKAFLDKSLLDNRPAIEKFLNDAAVESNQLLADRDMLAK